MRRLLVSLVAFFGLAGGALADVALIHRTGAVPGFSVDENGQRHAAEFAFGPLVDKGTDVSTLDMVAEGICLQMLGDKTVITDPFFHATNGIEAKGRLRCERGGYHVLVEVKSTPEKATFTVHVDLEPQK